MQSRLKKVDLQLMTASVAQQTKQPNTINMSYDPFLKPPKRGRKPRNSQRQFKSPSETESQGLAPQNL